FLRRLRLEGGDLLFIGFNLLHYLLHGNKDNVLWRKMIKFWTDFERCIPLPYLAVHACRLLYYPYSHFAAGRAAVPADDALSPEIQGRGYDQLLYYFPFW